MATIAHRVALAGAFLVSLVSAGFVERSEAGGRTAHPSASITTPAFDAVQASFTRYLLVTGIHLMPNGGRIWFGASSHLDGQVHTNTEFAFQGDPFFGDTVTSVGDKAWYYNKGSSRHLADDHSGVIDVPQFARGFRRGAEPVPLPDHSYDQQKATLGLDPDGQAPSNAMIRARLGLTPDGSPPPDGVYLVTDLGGVTGGIYVQGTVNQIMASADTVGGLQTFLITQGPTVKTITIDPAASTTSITIESQTTVFAGTPRGILFVMGDILDLRGPDREGEVRPSALLDGQQWLVVATGDIVLQNDIMVQNYDQGSAVLGIFSSGGSVRVGNSAPDEMSLDAFVMATGSAGAFLVDDYSSVPPRGMFHLRGGIVARYYGPFGSLNSSGGVQSGYGRDFRHDSRGLEPPWYPRIATSTLHVPSARSRSGLMVQSFPNPARESVRIRYALPRPGRVRLALFDVLGRRVATLVDAELPAGEHEATWTAASMRGAVIQPGLHVLELESGGEKGHARLVLLR